MVFDAACFDPRTCDKKKCYSWRRNLIFMRLSHAHRRFVFLLPNPRWKNMIFIAFKIGEIGPQGRSDLTTNRIGKSHFLNKRKLAIAFGLPQSCAFNWINMVYFFLLQIMYCFDWTKNARSTNSSICAQNFDSPFIRTTHGEPTNKWIK